MRSVRPLASGLILLLLAACAAGGPAEESSRAGAESATAAETATDPIDAIEAWQRGREERYHTSPMNAFTAIASHYIEEKTPVTLGASDDATELNPESPMPAMAEIRYDDGTFEVRPVEGADPPRLHADDEEGDPSPESEPLAGPYTPSRDKTVSVGGYFLTFAPQSGFGRIILYDPDSPKRAEFDGFEWFPASTKYQVKATWTPVPEPDQITIGTSRGLKKSFYRVGILGFTIDGEEQKLVALGMTGEPEIGEELFIPFRDATTGKESYEVGRYVDVVYDGPDGEYAIDFNTATNPLCNYSPHYNCPIPPKENLLTAAIRAGEMAYPHH